MGKNICGCGNPASGKGTGKYCSACERRRIEERTTKFEHPCAWCKKPVLVHGRKAMEQYRRTKRAYCSKQCMDLWVSAGHSERMRNTNKWLSEINSDRMRKNNPMRDPITRERQRTSLRAMGWKPTVRGGNGRSLPVPQRMLAQALGWNTEVVVATGSKVLGGLSTHYKIDIANTTLKIAIEVDGPSHNSPSARKRDQKKTDFLIGQGWIVLRFSNQEVMEHLEDVVQTVLSTTTKSKARQPTT
jgi:hypothetical protein